MDYDYEDKYVLMYGALEQDFEELQAEAEEVAALLQKAKENKRRLQAEIKFLKKRALQLKGSVNSYESPYGAAGEGSHYMSFAEGAGPTQVSGGRMLLDRDFHAQTFNTQVFNSQAVKPLSRGPASMKPSFKNQDVVGVLKTSSLKQVPNGFPPLKKSGKRKISWQDEYSVKA